MSLIPWVSLPSSFTKVVCHVVARFGSLIMSLYSRDQPVTSSTVAPAKYNSKANSSICKCWLATVKPLLYLLRTSESTVMLQARFNVPCLVCVVPEAPPIFWADIH